MSRRSWVVSLAACLLLSGPALVLADVPLTVFFDGTRADRTGPSGLQHGGTTFISAVRAVSVFDGLLSFDKSGNLARVTIDRRTMKFVVGNKVAYLDGMRVVLPAAPFKIDGDIYLPLATIARLGTARVAVDRTKKIVSFRSGGGDAFAQPQTGPLRQQDLDDVQPSPAQALSIVTTASVDADTGLHARAAVRNVTIKEYKLSFPTAKQIAFVLYRNGAEVWNSTAAMPDGAPGSLVIGPLETKVITADDPDFAKLGPGRYQMRVRLQTLIPLDLAPISIDDVPAPSPTR